MEIKITVPDTVVKAIEQAFPRIKKSVQKELVTSFIYYSMSDPEGVEVDSMIENWKDLWEIPIEKIINEE